MDSRGELRCSAGGRGGRPSRCSAGEGSCGACHRLWSPSTLGNAWSNRHFCHIVSLTEENLLFLEAWRTMDRAYLDKSFNGQNLFWYREDALRKEPMTSREETCLAVCIPWLLRRSCLKDAGHSGRSFHSVSGAREIQEPPVSSDARHGGGDQGGGGGRMQRSHREHRQEWRGGHVMELLLLVCIKVLALEWTSTPRTTCSGAKSTWPRGTW